MAAAALAVALGRGQTVVAPGDERYERAAAVFANVRKQNPSRKVCEARTYGPRLSFGLVNWAGYTFVLRFQLNRQYAAITRVAPRDGGEAYYIIQTFRGPRRMPRGMTEAQIPKSLMLYYSGSYLLGSGSYEVDTYLSGDDGQTCHAATKIKVPEGKFEPRVKPGTAAPAESVFWTGAPAGAVTKGRLTILLNATPAFGRRSRARLSPLEQGSFMTLLSAILDQGRYATVRFVAADLARQRVLLQEDGFAPRTLGQLAAALRETEFATISLEELKQQSKRPNRLLDELLAAEAQRETPSDAVLLVGFTFGWGDGAPKRTAAELEKMPPLVYLALPPMGMTVEDSIAQQVRSYRGKVVAVYGPQDLPKVLRVLGETMGR
jgi:hypothetical protein